MKAQSTANGVIILDPVAVTNVADLDAISRPNAAVAPMAAPRLGRGSLKIDTPVAGASIANVCRR